ncbi:ABC transporter permease [Patescibacteria group bacterium]
MNLTDTIKVALQSLITNKGRSLLTMLGVIIGVSSVILLVSIGNGLEASITDQFEDLGVNTIIIAPGDLFGDDEEGGFPAEDQQVAALSNNKLNMTHVNEVRKVKEFINAVTPMAIIPAEVTYKGETKNISVVGVSSEYGDIANSNPEEVGRFFTKAEEDKAERLAVMGFKINEELFGNIDPVGKSIKLNNQTYKVIGVVGEKGGGFGGPSFDTYVYVPIESYFKLFDTKKILRMTAQVKSADLIDESIEAVEKRLLRKLDDEDFSVFDQAEILDVISQILGALTAGLGGIAAISLLVGGIGIMNIMLVSVTERTREIGLRKALGATPNIILMQFLIESVALSVVGGMIGVGIASGAAFAISSFIPAVISIDAIILAFTVSVVVGVVFGVYPARRASLLSPIEALRSE